MMFMKLNVTINAYSVLTTNLIVKEQENPIRFTAQIQQSILLEEAFLNQERKVGGARRDRTDDLMLAKHALSQLSYGPGDEPA